LISSIRIRSDIESEGINSSRFGLLHVLIIVTRTSSIAYCPNLLMKIMVQQIL